VPDAEEKAYSTPPAWTDESAKHKAEKMGCRVEWASDYTLQLDIDSDADFSAFEQQLAMLTDLKLIALTEGYSVRRSRSGNRHINIELDDPLDIRDRILFQALLGSDRNREMLSLAGLIKGQKHPVLFFRPKEGK